MIRRSLTTLATVALAAGLLTSSAEAMPASDKGGGGITENEWLRINNPAHNSNGFGDNLNEVEQIVGHAGYSGEKWQQYGRTQWKRYYPPSQCPHGNTSIQFEEYPNAWRVSDEAHPKYEGCWGVPINAEFPYPD